MSEANTHDESLESLELDDDVGVLDIGMFESGSQGSGFHTKNDPKDPYQRREVIQRTGAVDIRCAMLDVVHGVMGPESDFWASILVFQFRFDPQKRARRIASATIELVFNATDPGNEMPELEAISFDGQYGFCPSKQTESTTIGGETNLGVNQIVTASGKATWARTVSRETSDRTTVAGGKLVVDNMPPNRVAKWTLLENSSLKSGIPASLRVAVRVQRRDEAVFTCMPIIKCKADKWTSMENLFGRVPEDDPILLNPELKATNKLMEYDVDSLGTIDLQDLGNIVATKTIIEAEDNK